MNGREEWKTWSEKNHVRSLGGDEESGRNSCDKFRKGHSVENKNEAKGPVKRNTLQPYFLHINCLF